MKRRYIFIVGLPRTGTKLIADILHNSQSVHCKISPENHFVGRLIKPGMRHEMKRIGDMSDDSKVSELVEAMYAGQFHGTYWELLRSGWLGVNRDVFLQELLKCGRSDKEIYEVIMRVHPEVTEETILGDKNPGHLYHVPTLLKWFPEAKIIHTFRDPRAILASEWKKRMGNRSIGVTSGMLNPFYSFMIVLHMTIAWLYAVRLHYKYQKLYPQNYYLSKFEDLVADPEKSIRLLCNFLGITFHPTMLDARQVDSSYAVDGETGFDEDAVTRWQRYLKPWMNTWLLFWGKKHLKEFGYVS